MRSCSLQEALKRIGHSLSALNVERLVHFDAAERTELDDKLKRIGHSLSHTS